MHTPLRLDLWPTATHPWLQRLKVGFWPTYEHPLVRRMMDGLAQAFAALGHEVSEPPQADTQVVIAAAPYGEPVNWRQAPLFTVRRRFGMARQPYIWVMAPVTPERLQADLARLEAALARDPVRPEDFAFPGLAPTAVDTLVEQGRRGGAILALQRAVQSQAKAIRMLLAVGQGEDPEAAYLFNLVGAYPRIPARPRPDLFFLNLALRLTTVASTYEITQHQVVGDPIPRAVWDGLSTPAAMIRAGREFGRRNFFTRMVRVGDLVHVPVVEASISSQYSEGCFATWDPDLDALVATITGSARPVDKGNLTEDELAVITGVRPDYLGAQVRHVEGKRNDPPSSEAVEMYDMDTPLPRISWQGRRVPVARSKLHSHRGVAAYDPRVVEFAPLDPAYYYFPVSCATRAQAEGIRAAFGRAESLRNPADPRRIVFTVLPGHGVVIAEKWVPGKAPFQAIWEAMDSGALVIDPYVPQGPFGYEPGPDGRMVMRETPPVPAQMLDDGAGLG
ncbi:MAG: hypothetical protein GXO37_04720 [Chloroflexi bacterium]|nr:hypothetical protein [Chloroflexota bacterium]